jgi:HEAT repeats
MRPLCLLALSACCFAQMPRIQNAKVQEREASTGLASLFAGIVRSSAEPVWIGYRVPRVQRHDSSEWGCSLDDGRNSITFRDVNTPVALEGPAEMLVLIRVEERKVQRLRTLSPDCLLDGAGLPFYWLKNAKPSETVSLLEGMVKDHSGMVFAIASTRDPSADAALKRLVDPSQPENVRRSAVRWLVDTPDGVPLVIRLARQDKDERFRRAAVNALASSKDPRARQFFEEILLR